MKTFYANCRTALSTMGVAAIVSVAMIPASCADPIKTQSYREQQRHEFRHVQNKDHVAYSAPTRSATPRARPARRALFATTPAPIRRRTAPRRRVESFSSFYFKK